MLRRFTVLRAIGLCPSRAPPVPSAAIAAVIREAPCRRHGSCAWKGKGRSHAARCGEGRVRARRVGWRAAASFGRGGFRRRYASLRRACCDALLRVARRVWCRHIERARLERVARSHGCYAERSPPRVRSGAGQDGGGMSGLPTAICTWSSRSSARSSRAPRTGASTPEEAGRKPFRVSRQVLQVDLQYIS